MTVALLLQCMPIQKVWNRTVGGSCIDRSKLVLGDAMPNIITNFAVLLAPIPMLCKLKVTRAQMIALCGIFLMGGLYALEFAKNLSSTLTCVVVFA